MAKNDQFSFNSNTHTKRLTLGSKENVFTKVKQGNRNNKQQNREGNQLQKDAKSKLFKQIVLQNGRIYFEGILGFPGLTAFDLAILA